MKYTLALLVLLFSCNALAQDNPYEPSRVRYKLPQVATVEGQKCLTPDQWQQVLIVASEYKGLFEWRLKIEPTLLAYTALQNSYERDIQILEGQIKILKDDREYLQLRLGQETKARTRFSKLYKLEKGLMWGIIAVETVVIAILGIKGTAN